MTATAPAVTSDKLTTFAYVLALKFWLGGPDYVESEARGTLDLQPGASRHQVFEQIRSDMVDDARSQGITGGATTVFWSLEPDTL